MEQSRDHTYKTLLKPSPEVLFKDRNSKFFGYAFPLLNSEEAGRILGELGPLQKKASHLCYAWQWGIRTPYYRVNDDGEPTNSAGMPIYGQIQAFGLTNVLVAVSRIYGGTKLGVGGLIQAYRTTAQLALESATIVEKTLRRRFSIGFPYQATEAVIRLLKRYDLTVYEQVFGLSCEFEIGIPFNKAEEVLNLFNNIPGLSMSEGTNPDT